MKITLKPESETLPTVTLALPPEVHRVLAKQASNMTLTLEEFVAGLVDLGYQSLYEDGGAKSYAT